MAWIERLFDRYFKFYFALILIGFVIAILLMNIPRLLATEPGQPNPKVLSRSDSAHSVGTSGFKNPLRVQLSNPKIGELTGAGQFFEYQGNKLSFIVRF